MITIAVLGLGTTIVDNFKNYFKKNHKGKKRPTKLFFGHGIVLFAIIIFTMILNSINQRKEKDNLAEQERIRKFSDSTIASIVNQKADSNAKILFDGISKSFNDQGLKLDSVNFEVTKLRDSAKVVYESPKVKDPVPVIFDNAITSRRSNDSLYITIEIRTMDESLKMYNVYYRAKIIYYDGRTRLGGTHLFGTTIEIPLQNVKGKTIWIGGDINNIKEIYFGLVGTYKGPYNTSKEKPLRMVVRYDLETSKAHDLDEPFGLSILEEMKLIK